jgi:hypothetical protein
MKRARRRPRDRSLVRLVPESAALAGRKGCPFRATRTYVFLGEIPNMPGHCIVADIKTGRLFSGYHTEQFREVTDEEL